MKTNIRQYNPELDYKKVSSFLANNSCFNGTFNSNWLEPRWEYMNYHPGTNNALLPNIGIYEDNNEIAGVVSIEHNLGHVYLFAKNEYRFLYKDMISYAEKNFLAVDKNKKKYLRIYPLSNNYELIEQLSKSGYQAFEYNKEWCEILEFDLSVDIKLPFLPEGYSIIGLNEEYDIYKVDRVLWRGFNHKGEPDPNEIKDRELMHSAPNFNKSLNIVVKNDNGDYVAYAGVWFDKTNSIAYVEPVATDPDYRRKGFGKAAVLEGLKRAKLLGAKCAIVESGLKFYHSIGFKHLLYRCPWIKYFN